MEPGRLTRSAASEHNRDVDWSDAVAAAIGGAIAVVGTIAGSLLTRQDAKRAAEEARISRFEDRILQVAAELLHVSLSYRTWVFDRLMGREPALRREMSLEEDWPRLYWELRLMVREQSTRDALDKVDTIMWDVALWKDEKPERRPGFFFIDRDWRAARFAFEQAMRNELRVEPLPDDAGKTGDGPAAEAPAAQE
jgi:hypothetical protein